MKPAPPVTSTSTIHRSPANIGHRWSRSDTTGFRTGHLMSNDGSFHIIPDSWSGEYSFEVWYATSAYSLSTQNPCAHQSGTYIILLSSADRSTPTHFPAVAEWGRRSTATSKILPLMTRTSLLCACGGR